MAKLAVLRIRGKTGLTQDKKDTLKMLNLLNKNHCVILDDSPITVGMIKKVKDYVTWGEIDEIGRAHV